VIPVPPRAQWANEHTSAVAHELNNVLTIIRTYTHFARQPTTKEQAAQDLRVVAAAAERASALVDWLASMSEESRRAADEVSASEFVSGVSAKLEQLVQSGTTIEILRLSADVSFRANALRLEHVVMSLALAATQRWAATALKFSVEQTSGVAADRLDLGVGQYAALVVTCVDASKPSHWQEELVVPPDQLSALVAPFAELLRAMGGKLEFIRTSSVEDRFELYLPASPSAPRQASKPRLALVPPSVNTVCIIENETAIRLAIRRTLSAAGHFVVEANDSVGARKLLIQHGRAVRLLVCDASLLSESEDLFTWVRVTCPNAALLLISGSEHEGKAKASSLRARFLAKPFTPAQLASAVLHTIARADADARGQAALERPVVLVVDDERVIRDSLQRLLVECDFDTIVACSGNQALQLMSERHVDAVVTDQFMTGLGGIHLLEQVYERFPDCVRVLCTGYPSSDVVIAAVNQGRVQRVLPKSMHAVALRDEIERAVLEGMPRK
jgi:CheY-like chemotaxis protein